jgi:hypothetical protein
MGCVAPVGEGVQILKRHILRIPVQLEFEPQRKC